MGGWGRRLAQRFGATLLCQELSRLEGCAALVDADLLEVVDSTVGFLRARLVQKISARGMAADT